MIECEPVRATRWSDFRTNGGQAAMAAVTAALADAINRAPAVELPGGTITLDRIAPTQRVRLRGAGIDDTVLKRGDGLNKHLFLCANQARGVIEHLTIDMNPANNTGAGGHNGFDLTDCSRWHFRRVRFIGARGLYNGANVGAAINVLRGYGCVFEDCEFEDGYDGYVLSAHTDAIERGSWFKSHQRCGPLVSNGSHNYQYDGIRLIGNCTLLPSANSPGGAGVLILQSNSPKGKNVIAKGQVYGPGVQHNQVTDFGLADVESTDNAYAAGVDCHQSTGAIRGGVILRNKRNVEIDTLADVSASDVRAGGGLEYDWSVFKSKAHLRGCQGRVQGWSQDQTGATSSEIIIDDHVGDITLVANECKNVRLSRVTGVVSDPGLHVVTATQPAALQAGWVADTYASFRKDETGTVYINGRIKNGTVAANTVLFTLPVGYRPAATEYFMIFVCGSIGGIYILADGRVCDMGGSLSAVWSSLDTLVFKAA